MFRLINDFIMKDFLSLYFIFIILIVAIPVVIYSVGYIDEYKEKYSIKYFWFMMLSFIFSMMGVVFSTNSIEFVIFWELMSVFSFFLVIYEYDKKENIKSGIMYFIMTRISGLFLIVMFIIIAKFTNSTDFKTIMLYAPNLSSNQNVIILIFSLLAFGSKSGLVPFHAWLPKAHPSAPSNVSALMSGVMLKVAIYGFIRINFTFLDKIPLGYDVSIVIIGTFTAIFAIVNALPQNDIKKILAYSSAENIGIIFAALGLSLILSSYGFTALSLLTLTAALFHCLNHAIFKSLLFTCAGSVLYATSSKNINELGGLYNKMKLSAFCALIGTLAISAVPPLNGFASEILIFKNFVEASTIINNPSIMISIFFCGILLALTSGGVVWVSIKNFGLTYLGKPRTNKAINIKKVPKSMNIGMGILSLLAIVLGIFSPFFITYIYNEISTLLDLDLALNVYNFGIEITLFSGIVILISLIIYFLTRFLSRGEKVERDDTWSCGFNNPDRAMQYSSSGFTQPASRLFGQFTNYKKEVRLKETIFLKQSTEDLIEKHLYSNIIGFFNYVALKINKMHYGKIQIYISYIFITLIVSLFLVLNFI